MSRTAGATASSEAFSETATKELDVYAAEFAKLVATYTPSRSDAPSAWLGRLPDEALDYYHRGISTFGTDAGTPVERRGRLYLIHTSLLFMWMNWGKDTARTRFQEHLEKGTRRTASLVMLEYYRRAGVLTHYDVPNWFYQPVEEWTVCLKTDALDPEQVSDGDLKRALQTQDLFVCEMPVLSSLHATGAIPSLHKLSLE